MKCFAAPGLNHGSETTVSEAGAVYKQCNHAQPKVAIAKEEVHFYQYLYGLLWIHIRLRLMQGKRCNVTITSMSYRKKSGSELFNILPDKM